MTKPTKPRAKVRKPSRDWLKILQLEADAAPEDGVVELWPDTVLLMVKALREAERLTHGTGSINALHKAVCDLRSLVEDEPETRAAYLEAKEKSGG